MSRTLSLFRLNAISNGLRSISNSSSVSSLSFFSRKSNRNAGTGYVILIPEVPEASLETNELLRIQEIPTFQNLTTVDWRNALIKLCLDFEITVWKTEEELKGSGSNSPTIEQISKSLDTASVPLDYVWSLLKTLSIVKSNTITPQGYAKLHERARAARARKYLSKTIYNVCRDLQIPSVSSTSSTPQSRLLSKYLTEATLSGIKLTGKAYNDITEIRQSLLQDQENFRTNLNEATTRFEHVIIDSKYVGKMPLEILTAISRSGTEEKATTGPWIIRLSFPSYNYFMEYCPVRALRWNAWQAYESRASQVGGDKNISNSIPIEEIRSKRTSIAKLLGYDSYVDLSMVTKMAGSVENVKTMIASLFVVANEKQSEEISSLQSYAESDGFDNKLKIWDIPYCRRNQSHQLFAIDHTHTEAYFPYPVVVSRMFQFASELFGIQIKRIPSKKLWHEDVEFYSVEDKKGFIGNFFLDPYSRPGEKLSHSSWMLGNRSKFDALSLTPLATLIFNFRPPLYGKPSLLSFNDMTTLFQRFGEMLQHLLTTIPFPDISGTTNIEWDATKVASSFMGLWLENKGFVSSLSSHYESGNAIPDTMLTNLLRSRKHLAGYDLTHQLYLSDLDIELHSSSEFWMDVMKRLWSLYKSSAGLLLEKADSHPCNFEEIFIGNSGASYYSTLWSRMVAADVYRAFVENGRDRKSWGIAGSRFRSTFLAMGGGYHSSEVFRQFRGRDPSPDALLWVLGLKNSPDSGNTDPTEEKGTQAKVIDKSA